MVNLFFCVCGMLLPSSTAKWPLPVCVCLVGEPYSFFSTYLSAFFKYVKQQMRCVMVCWIAPRGRREFKKIFCPSKRKKTKTPGRVRVFFNLCNSFLSSFYLNPSKRERPERAVAASRDYTGKEQGWAWCAGRNHNNISPHLFSSSSSWPTFLRD